MEAPSPDHAAEDAIKDGASHSGLFRSLRELLATLVTLTRTRLELLQVELQEEQLRLASIGLLAMAAVFFLALAMVVVTLFVILLFWDTHRVLVTGVVALVYLLVGLACATAARTRAKTQSTLFTASIAQLEADRERLSRPD